MIASFSRQPRILLTGVTGQVGRALVALLPGIGEVIATVREPAQAELSARVVIMDARDEGVIRAVMREVAPEVVVNTAAYTNVDRAEDEPETAWKVNARAPAVLAAEAAKLGALLVHFSTDYVFDGSGTRAYRESDSTRPLCVYGRSKLEGELAIRTACERHVILRSSWIYSAGGRNFFTSLLERATTGDQLRVVTDQIGAPTPASVLAEIACRAIRQLLNGNTHHGTYHATCGGACSRFEFACHVLELTRGLGLPLKVERVVPVRLEELGLRAVRPKNCRLDCSRLRKMFGIEAVPWQEPLPRMVEELLGLRLGKMAPRCTHQPAALARDFGH